MRLTTAVRMTFALCTLVFVQVGHADEHEGEQSIMENAYLDFRLRYENVEQNNALKDAQALTLRTVLGYETKTYSGWSGTLELEDVRIVGGVDEYSVPPTGFNTGIYSVIPDPETTEVNQGFIKYDYKTFTGKLGRQEIVLDNQRFVGNVGWRQDHQSFDAARFLYAPTESVKLEYSYINKRNRIFAEARDLKSKDNLLRGDYKTSFGTFVGYAYLLEVDNNINNGLDTLGLRFKGKTDRNTVNLLYTLEYASQDFTGGPVKNSADYLFAEGGIGFKGITAKLGYEVLGSDNGNYGFSTPLATLHAFNGWADQFLITPAQGLEDVYISAGGKVGGGKWKIVYHDYSADVASPTVNDLGSELDLAYVYPFAKRYKAGIKYAAYSAGDLAASKVDTDKLWIWMTASF